MKLFVQILVVAACIFAASSLSIAGILDAGANVADNVAGVGLNVVDAVANASLISTVNGAEWTAGKIGSVVDIPDSVTSTEVKVASSVVDATGTVADTSASSGVNVVSEVVDNAEDGTTGVLSAIKSIVNSK